MILSWRFRIARGFQSDAILVFAIATAVFSQASSEIDPGRTCHWCGPLAEQVHRSRRAPPCSAAAPEHTTLCDAGLAHCAVVATGPPQVISRYCVKQYQDECYSQFCNTTQKWKMTCPCKGDFCNGDIGERERDAFILLAKLTSKTHIKIKKRNVSAKFISGRKKVDKLNETLNSALETTNLEDDKVNEKNYSLTQPENHAIMQSTSVNLSANHDEVSNSVTTPSVVTKEIYKQINNNFNDEKGQIHDKDPIENETMLKENALNLAEQTMKMDEEIKLPMIINSNKNELESSEINIKNGIDINGLDKPDTIVVTEKTVLMTILEAKLSINSEYTKPSISNIQPTAKIPSESLQQNVPPKSDSVEKVSTTEVTETEGTTTNVVTTTTMKPKMKKNNSARNSLKFMSFLLSSITSIFLL